MDQRLEMLEAPGRYGLTVSEAAALWGVSRETFYVWRRRFEAQGVAGLADRPCVPACSPGRIGPLLEAQIVDWRRAHPRWGARRIRAELVRQGVLDTPPARSTVHRVLVRNGLVAVSSSGLAAKTPVRFERSAPNELWQIDGLEYPLGDGTTAHVVSLLDDHSRLCCATRAFLNEDNAAAIAVFDDAVTALGLPYSTLSDRGTAFTGRVTNSVSPFERHLWPQGVMTINGRGYHPQTQGKIERWHRTLREWLDDNGPYTDLAALNTELARFQQHYNHHRPHQGIGDTTPGQRFDATPPRHPDLAATATHRRRQTLRSTASNGNLRYAQWLIGLGRPWANTKVRIVDTGDTITIYDAGDTLIRTITPDPDRNYLGTGAPRGRPRQR